MSKASDIHSRVLDNVDRLPPMPQAVAEVMEMSKSEDFSTSALADVVCRDPTLASRVLSLCNSGFHGLSQEITSVQRAVVLLGFDMVRNLVFATFVNSVVQDDVEGYAQTAASLWEHSFGAATAAMVVANQVAPQEVDAAYTAGLIHDIGKVALATFVAESFAEVLSRVQSRRQSFSEAELEVLGTTHADVGALIAERWKFAPSLCEVIGKHHRPSEVKGDPRLGAMVSLADGICSLLGIGAGLDAVDCALDEWSLSCLGLRDEKLQRTMDEVTTRLLDLKGSQLLTSM